MKKRFLLQKLPFMAFLLPALILSFSSLNLNAKPTPFNESNIPVHLEFLPNFAAGTASWTLDATVDNVECYYKIENCNGSTSVFLKFNNKNTGNVKITWEEIFATQHEKASPGFVGKKELILLPGSTSDYDCSGLNALLIIRSAQISPAYPVEVSQFKFSKITVTNL
jgi:hypothetical protein